MRQCLILAALTGLAAAGIAASAPAAEVSPTIVVEHAWSRPSVEGRPAVIYLTITDHGPPDRLIAITAPVAGRIELHETTKDGDVMRMRPVSGIAVTPDKPVQLAPGGYHAMLFNLKQKLTVGETFPATLTFEKAGALTTTVTVEAGGPDQGMKMAPGMKMESGMQMDGGTHH